MLLPWKGIVDDMRQLQGGAGILIPDQGPAGRFSHQAIKKNLDLPMFLPENGSDFSNADF
jgi:hypothetical protein